jgi:hypothetical protein
MIPEPDFPDIEIIIKQTECRHIHTILETTGSRWFDGDVCDDYQTVERCCDCGYIFVGEEDYGEDL